MINVNDKECLIHIPKLLRCKKAACNIYLLILQNNFTRDVWLFKVRDFNPNDIRYNLWIEFPECFEQGEYSYFLVAEDDWNVDEIYTSYPVKTQKVVNKGAVTFNCNYILTGDTMLVTSKMQLDIYCGGRKFTELELPVDNYTYGELVKELDVLNTGLLKYHIEKICDSGYEEYSCGNQNTFIQYNGPTVRT